MQGGDVSEDFGVVPHSPNVKVEGNPGATFVSLLGRRGPTQVDPRVVVPVVVRPVSVKTKTTRDGPEHPSRSVKSDDGVGFLFLLSIVNNSLKIYGPGHGSEKSTADPIWIVQRIPCANYGSRR